MRVILLTVLLLSAAAVALPRAAHADVMVQEGTAFSGTVVATPNCAAISPTIDWGDGTPTSAGTTVAGPQGPATVHGTHTYAEAGTYTGTVTYTCAQFAGQQQVQFTATVSDAPLTPTGLNFSGTVTSELAPTTAHVDDANPDSVSSDFTATIDWGDGSSSAGTVSASGGGGYDIAGSHTYDEPGTYMVTTSVTDPGGGTSAASTATIGGPHTPDTSIDSGPSGTINTAGPTFAFSSDTLGATFQCSLDGAAYTTCATPLTLGPLSDGPHTFAVRALASGRTDPTPATRMFSVDTGPPDTTIDSGPTGVTTARTPQFTFSSNRADSTYECSVDGATFVACTSPLTTAALADGPHQLAVRAVEGGQTDPTPATRAFSVDTTAPDTTIVSGPDDGAALDPAAAAPVYGFTSSEPGSSFLCRTYLVGSAPGAFTPCATPAAATPTGQGTWQFEVAAVDPAGNADPTPASRTFANIAPDTTITEGPSGTTWTVRPLFGFASTIDGSTFQCRVDGSSWADCATPLLLPTLTAGPHEFAVRAISPQHITDPTPAVRDFSVAAAYTAPQQQCRVLIPQYTFDNATGATPYHQALCTLPLGTCPVGARCTMHASSTVTEAGNQGTFPYMTGEIFMAPTGGYGGCGNAHYLGPQASGAVPYRFGPGGCSFALDSGFLGASPLTQVLGGPRPSRNASIVCDGDMGIYDAAYAGPPEDRYMLCQGQLTVAPSTPVIPYLLNHAVQLFAPGQGAVAITVALGNGSTHAATAARAPRTIAHRTVQVSSAQVISVPLTLPRHERRLLARRGSLTVRVRVGFTPAGAGPAMVKTRRATLTGPRPPIHCSVKACRNPRQARHL